MATALSAAAREERNFSHIEQHGIVSLGGVDRDGRPVLLAYACRLPPKEGIDHSELLEYLRYTLDQFVENDYTIVYFHHGLRSTNKPGMQWLLQAYRALDRSYKKNLKKLYLVHPTNFIKVVMTFFRPFISAKFGRKVSYVDRIADLGQSLFVDQLEIPDEVIQFDAKQTTSKSSSAAQPGVPKVVSISARPMFGVPLPVLLKQYQSVREIPVVRACIDYLMRNGLKVEGILRRSGNSAEVREAKAAFNSGMNYVLEDVHVASSLLKLFFRELPEPVLTYKLYTPVCMFQSLPAAAHLPTLQKLLSTIPEENRVLIFYLLELLVEVVKLSDTNMMTAQNIAIVFGPNLVWSDQEKISLSSTQQINVFVAFLVDEGARLLSGPR